MKYKLLTILFRNNPEREDVLDGGTHKVDFHNAALSVSGDYLIISEHSEDGEEIEGQLFHLKTIHSYKTFRQ